MKTRVLYYLVGLFFLMASGKTAQAQAQLEVPGDNFSLEGALELFKKSGSPEEFERMLNDPDSRVNNLDLNGDGYIDYIRVIDRYEGNVHAFILQAVISERQSQDIAVITLEKRANNKAVLQIIGDEDIYGVETIIEPTREVRTYGGAMTTNVVVDVWAWPFVQYVYGPRYTVWISPWGWYHRPVWWHPWRPVFYYDYYSYWHPYRPFYRVCHTHRVVYVDRIYRPHRTTSVIVHNRYNRQITHYRSTRIDDNGRYRGRSDRNNSRVATTSVRYNSNGRVVSDRSTSSRSATDMRTGTRSSESNGRSSVNSRTDRSYSRESSATNDRSSNARRSTERSSDSYRESSGSNQRSSTSTDMQRSRERSLGSTYREPSGTSRSERSYSSGSSGSNQRSSSPNVQPAPQQRSSESPSYRGSSGNSRSERSYSSGSSGGNQRSSSPSIQRSSPDRSSSGRSSGSSGSERSSSSNSRGRR